VTANNASLLDDIIQRVNGLPEDQREALIKDTIEATKDKMWFPNPGPQTDAYFSKADVLLYGGQAGGGKSHLELGVAINEHRAGIIFRRELTQTDGLEKEGKMIIGDKARYNGQDNEWTWTDGKTLKLAGMSQPDDWRKHAGRERDLYCFDEAGEFLEMQVAQIIAWLRAPEGQRCRVILGSNPPRSAEGLWMVKWFAPWLDDKFPDPATPGELRWAVYVMKEEDDEGAMHWVDGPGDYEIDGEYYGAKSYTFIPASLHDNPYRDTPEYRRQLQSLPEPLRSQLLYGKFTTALKDLPNQLIPTEWIRQAMERPRERPEDIPMCSIGVDCSGGGSNPMVLAPRYDGYYDDLIKIPGSEIPAEKAGAYAAGFVLANRRDKATVVVDMGGGYGGPLYEHLVDNEIEVEPYRGAEASIRRTREGKLKFTNTRSAAYWGFREALDPGQPGGSPISLPNDPRLLAGLSAPTFEVTPQGIKVEPKVKRDEKGRIVGGVMKKLGFSPDEADAVVEGWYYGDKQVDAALQWLERKEKKRMRGTGPKVVMSKRYQSGR